MNEQAEIFKFPFCEIDDILSCEHRTYSGAAASKAVNNFFFISIFSIMASITMSDVLTASSALVLIVKLLRVLFTNRSPSC